MTGGEFDALVNNLGCFAVMHGHVDDEFDSVVGRNSRYVLVLPSSARPTGGEPDCRLPAPTPRSERD